MPSDNRSRASSDRPLPQNLDAERAVLGAILLAGIRDEETDAGRLKVLSDAADHLHSGEFFLDQHERIFRQMLVLATQNKAIDLITLTESLHHSGELDAAGGAPYLASLADGMPHVSNVQHYAKIVAEKARLRKLMHLGNNLMNAAMESDADSPKLLAKLDSFVKEAQSNGFVGDRRLVAVDVLDFLMLNFDPIDFVIEPILPVGNSAMVFATPGAGKTHVMMQMAYCVAIGAPNCLVWDVPKARPVVYVDGELDQKTLQDWQLEIAKSFVPVLPQRGNMKIITPDQQPKFPPRINTKDGRARIEQHCQPGGLLVLDNLFTLCPGADEKETEDWAIQQEWILYLRRNRIAVFMVQHANRTGTQQYGTSKREIQLSCNLMLTVPQGHTPDKGLLVEAQLKKLRRWGRNSYFNPRWGQPFEITFRVVDGAAEFSTRPMKDILKKRALELLINGAHPKEVMDSTGLDRFTVYRLRAKLKSEGAAAAEASE